MWLVQSSDRHQASLLLLVMVALGSLTSRTSRDNREDDSSGPGTEEDRASRTVLTVRYGNNRQNDDRNAGLQQEKFP